MQLCSCPVRQPWRGVYQARERNSGMDNEKEQESVCSKSRG